VISQKQFCKAEFTIINVAKAKKHIHKILPYMVGTHLKKIDTALPGRHTLTLYNALGRREANVLAQLRTGMARLNEYLYRIGAVESDQCAYG
jgi:hypothetical protein